MTAALTRSKSTKLDSQEQLAMSFETTTQTNKSPNPVDFEIITADVPKGKEPKSIRVDRGLLSKTERLRGQTNLNFSEYVETALTYFNACLAEHLSEQEDQADDAA